MSILRIFTEFYLKTSRIIIIIIIIFLRYSFSKKKSISISVLKYKSNDINQRRNNSIDASGKNN